MDETEKIPPFVQEYLDQMEYEGYADFVKLSRDYYKEQEDYPGKFAEQSAHLNQLNRITGQNRNLNYEDGLKKIDITYSKKAYQTAKQHGFKGADPNLPSDKEFTKQGAKFQEMIDKAKQQSQEEQRAEFLEKIKSTKEKATQKIDQDPEI